MIPSAPSSSTSTILALLSICPRITFLTFDSGFVKTYTFSPKARWNRQITSWLRSRQRSSATRSKRHSFGPTDRGSIDTESTRTVSRHDPTKQFSTFLTSDSTQSPWSKSQRYQERPKSTGSHQRTSTERHRQHDRNITPSLSFAP